MPKVITDTQLYKVLELLTQEGEMTIQDISERTGYSEPSLRRTISDMKQAGRIRKRILYGLK